MADQYLLGSVSHALEILDLLNQEGELNLTDICKHLGLGKASAFRLLYTLEHWGFVHKTSQARYKLGLKFAHYGANLLGRQSLVETAKPFLQALRDEFNETTHIAILDKSFQNIIIMDKEMGKSSIQMSSQIGEQLPAYCTGNGKTLLAYLNAEDLDNALNRIQFIKYTETTITSREDLLTCLKHIRAAGYSEDIEESEVGLVCYSSPVRNFQGKVVAGVSISGPSVRMRQNQQALVAAVKRTAANISTAMGYMDGNE